MDLRVATLIASSVIMGFLIFGVLQRRNRRVHIPTMIGCCIADIALVLVIELNRSAINTATTTTDPLMRFHVAVSVTAVLCYFVALYTGFRRRRNECLRIHKWNAMLFLFCRSSNWVTSFFVGNS